MNKNDFAVGMRALALSAATATLVFAGSASADSLAYNSAPAGGWFYGVGNNYAPANTLVLTTDAGDQLYARAHETFQVAPASVGNVYSFPTGPSFISFDWGIDSHTGTLNGLTALITLTNAAGGSFSYNPFYLGNDNAVGVGRQQNSNRWNYVPLINFNPNIDGTYNFRLDVDGFDGGPRSISYDLKIGKGFAAVPEPSTWAMMIAGFGLAGVMLRRRRAPTA